MSDISNQAGTVTNSLSESLRDFKAGNPQFDYGITSIGDLYRKEINIDDFYAPKESHPYLRKALFASELIAEGFCGYIRFALPCSAISMKKAQVVLGIYNVRMAFNFLNDQFLKPTRKPFDLFLMNIGQVDSDSASQISEAVNNVRKINIKPILTISKTLIKDAKSENLSEETLLKIERLKTLVSKVNTEPKIKKIVAQGCQIISFALGAAYVFGNYGTAGIAHYIADPMAQYARASIDVEQDNFQRYITLSEMLYLCDGLINGNDPLSIES